MTDRIPDDRPRLEPVPPHAELERASLSPRILLLVALAVGLVIAAVGAGVFRDRLARVIGPEGSVTESQERLQLQQRVEQLESELELSQRQAAGVTASTEATGDPAETPGVAPVAELSVFEDRIIAIEASQARMARAAAAAVAAGTLADAAQGSEPFAGELASMERLVPTSRAIRALGDLAEQGAPTRAALAGEFPEAAARAARAGRGDGSETGFFDSVSRALGQIFTLRRIGSVEGDHPDAVLARAERFVREGDLEDALTELQALPEPSRDAMANWIGRAQRRVEIERRINALRAQALGDLSGVSTAETGAPL